MSMLFEMEMQKLVHVRWATVLLLQHHGQQVERLHNMHTVIRIHSAKITLHLVQGKPVYH